jgi:deazaflavin-dependent oxidoreductase (nitroreductase family)
MSETPAEYNAKIIAEFRANEGRVGGIWEGTALLLLHHAGAKSSVSRVNPVAYLPDEERFLLWAANGGASKRPDWYHNLKAHRTRESRSGARRSMSSPMRRQARSTSVCSRGQPSGTRSSRTSRGGLIASSR